MAARSALLLIAFDLGIGHRFSDPLRVGFDERHRFFGRRPLCNNRELFEALDDLWIFGYFRNFRRKPVHHFGRRAGWMKVLARLNVVKAPVSVTTR